MIAASRFQHVSSSGLAVVVHGFFLLALVLSVSWKNQPHLPVEADLWVALPEPGPAAPAELPLPLPEPESAPVPPGPAEADIALRKAEQEKLRREEELRLEDAARKEDEARQQEAKRQAEQQARLRQEQEALAQAERAEQARIEKIKQVMQQQQMEQDLARQAQAEMDAEAAQVRALQARAARQARVVEDFRQRIQAKVLSYVRLPQRLNGNPEAVFQVNLFANGEVRSVRLVQSSGQPAYDEEVERAILKASPLPLPNEKEAAAAFRGGITMKFRPYPNGGSGGP